MAQTVYNLLMIQFRMKSLHSLFYCVEKYEYEVQKVCEWKFIVQSQTLHEKTLQFMFWENLW